MIWSSTFLDTCTQTKHRVRSTCRNNIYSLTCDTEPQHNSRIKKSAFTFQISGKKHSSNCQNMLPAAGTLLFNRDLKLTCVCGIQIKWWNMRFSFTSMVSAIVTDSTYRWTTWQLSKSEAKTCRWTPPGGRCAAVKVINHHAHFMITDGKWARLKYTFCSNDGFHHFR